MRIKTLAKAIDLLEFAAWADGPASLKEIVSGLGLSAAAASRLASDLVEAGLLRKAGYRRFEPALGMIHLGQRAMLNYAFPQKVTKTLRARCRAKGLQGGLAGVFKGRLVYLYNSQHDEAPGRLGLPYTYQVCDSNIALAVLTLSLGRKAALKTLRESLKKNSEGLPFSKTIDSYKSRMDMLEREGCSLLDGGSYWNCCVPLRWRNETLGLALYGSPEAAGSKTRLVSETKKLLADIEELALNIN